MKKRLFSSLLLAVIAVSSFSSCKKDKEEEVAVTKENLVGDYKLVSIKVKSGSETSDITDQYVPGCQRDDIYKLNADGSFAYVDAGTVCEPAGDYEGQWTLEAKTLEFDLYEFNITKFSGSTLVGGYTETVEGISYYTEFTFAKQ